MIKAKINGVELEGEASEIVEVIKAIKSKKEETKTELKKEVVYVNRKKPKSKNYKKYGRGMSRKAVSKIIDTKYNEAADLVIDKGYTITKAVKKIFKFRKSGVGGTDTEYIRKVLKKRGYDYDEMPQKGKKTKRRKKRGKYKPRKKKRKPNKAIKSDDKRIVRGRFMTSRAKWMCENYGISYDEGLKRASEEWKNGKKQKTLNMMPTGSIPIILKNQSNNKLLFDCLGNIIANNGVLTFNKDSGIFNIDDEQKWNAFVALIFLNIKTVVEYFNVNDNFKLRKHLGGSLNYLQYC